MLPLWKWKVVQLAPALVVLSTALILFCPARGHGEEPPHGGGPADGTAETAPGDKPHGGGAHHDPYDLSAANASENLENIADFRSDLAIWTLVVFGLLMALLIKFGWGPIRDALDAREQNIADHIEEAHKNCEESRRLLIEHEAKMAKASEEVRNMLDGARKDAELRKQEIIAEAENAARSEKDRAIREITAAKNSALEDLAKTSVDQAVGLAGQIVGRTLNRDDHASLIQESLQRFPSEN